MRQWFEHLAERALGRHGAIHCPAGDCIAIDREGPEEFGKWGSVYRQFRRWTQAGLWENILLFLNDSDLVSARIQMIPFGRLLRNRLPATDSTVVRAHQQAAGSRGRDEPLRRHVFETNGE